MAELKVGVVDVFVIDPTGAKWKVLLLRRAAGTRCTGAWEIVHGRIEERERPEDAAIREVREETSLEVGRLYNVTCQPFYLHRLSVVQISVVFAAFVDSAATVTLGPEHDALDWTTVERARQRLAWPRSRAVMLDVFELLKGGDAGPLEDVLRVI